MSEPARYRVLRHMEGDKSYAPGDERELDAIDARHLLALGVIEPVEANGEAADADLPSEPNKTKVQAAPAHKVEGPKGRKAPAAD